MEFLQGIHRQFLLNIPYIWETHRFEVWDKSKAFITCCNSDKGPIIIYFECGLLAILFEPDPKYPMTIKIIDNFIEYSLKQITRTTNKNKGADPKSLIENF